jgi:prepilin-type processing-associated H-X9-DG protein
MQYQKTSRIRRPSRLITVADGVYAGRQRDSRIGTANSRIGYRHPNNTANAAFADGHVEVIAGNKFPRAFGTGVTMQQGAGRQFPDNPTVYMNPERALGP